MSTPSSLPERPPEGQSYGLAGLVGWMTRNRVASNLLMIGLLGGGILASLHIKQEVFPSFQLPVVDISISYPGASPEEVEEGIVLAVEEELRGLPAVERILSTAGEGGADIAVELREDMNVDRALQEVKNAIDRVSSLPDEVENPEVELREEQSSVFWMVLYGPFTEHQIFDLAERVRRDLVALPEITQVSVNTPRDPEIMVEIPQAKLRSLGLTLGEVAQIIRVSARDLPAGGVRTSAGEIMLRTRERRNFASEYGDISLVSKEDGTDVRLQDVARILDGFEDRPMQNLFNGGQGIFISVWETGEEKPLEIARAVNAYLDQLRKELPPGAGIHIMRDNAAQYQDRLNLLLSNGAFGLGLVIVVLGLFLAPRLAFWVALGVPTTIVGALLLLPPMDASINMISLFAFIITLGIVVDDAVIVGENVFHKIQQGEDRLHAAVEGTREMIVPILYAVLTNIIAFVPLIFVPGETGRFFEPLPAVVIAVFTVSLVEALFILPSHLAHGKVSREASGILGGLTRLQEGFSNAFERMTAALLLPMLRACQRYRWLALALIFAPLAITFAWYESGRMSYTFDPVITSIRVDAEFETPIGSAFDDGVRIANHIEAAGIRVAEEFGGVDKVLGGRMNVMGRRGENEGEVNFYLVPPEERNFTEEEFARRWREEVGDVPGMKSLFYEWEEGPGSGAGLTVELSHPDRQVLESAAAELAEQLATFSGVSDINDGFSSGKAQIDVDLTPEGYSLGLTPEFVGRQVRHSFYGAEALRFQRGRHEVKVMVRLPASERLSRAHVENLIIQTPTGGEVPLSQVARLKEGRAYTEIIRVDGQRVLEVTCNVDPEVVNVNAIRGALNATILPKLAEDYRGLSTGFSGRQREERRAIDSLKIGLAGVSIITFALIAALFQSYFQSFVIMLTIPFSTAAALLGHLALGYDLSIVSVFGMIALSGLVVNGGIVLYDEMNRLIREQGMHPDEAVVAAAYRRFRPIMLTSLTTFVGLAPMIFETSSQARFLVPMAISLGFGTLFSTPVVLLLPVCLSSAWHSLQRQAKGETFEAAPQIPEEAS